MFKREDFEIIQDCSSKSSEKQPAQQSLRPTNKTLKGLAERLYSVVRMQNHERAHSVSGLGGRSYCRIWEKARNTTGGILSSHIEIHLYSQSLRSSCYSHHYTSILSHIIINASSPAAGDLSGSLMSQCTHKPHYS